MYSTVDKARIRPPVTIKYTQQHTIMEPNKTF